MRSQITPARRAPESGDSAMLRQEKWFNLIGKKLRDESKNVAQEPLPRRWVDLIRYLDEQERQRECERALARPRDRKH
jgi:hypothetical protein